MDYNHRMHLTKERQVMLEPLGASITTSFVNNDWVVVLHE
jgi:hypothetical protein